MSSLNDQNVNPDKNHDLTPKNTHLCLKCAIDPLPNYSNPSKYD